MGRKYRTSHPEPRAPRSFNLILALLLAGTASAQTGENVLVIVNTASNDSRRIAEYYVSKRSVPLANVCRVTTATVETIDWQRYLREIEEPVRECALKALRRGQPIQYIATTLGVPLRVSGPGKGLDAESASLDSELALLFARMRGSTFQRRGPVPNPFFGRRERRFNQKEFPIFLTTRLAAYNVNTVLRMIDRSLAARNRGKVILDARSGDEEPGDAWLKDAAVRLPPGRAVFDDSSRVLEGQKQVIGYGSWGSNDPARKRRDPAFEWLPGAIVNEFVSTNGRTLQRPPASWQLGTWKNPMTWFAGSPQSMSADSLEQGATGVSGAVDEPYLANCPRPDLLFPAYIEGRTLAESFYLATRSLSWQTVIFGDPLCRLR